MEEFKKQVKDLGFTETDIDLWFSKTYENFKMEINLFYFEDKYGLGAWISEGITEGDDILLKECQTIEWLKELDKLFI